MENEYCFELNRKVDLEKRFQLNGAEYLLKYYVHTDYNPSYPKKLTIQSLTHVPVFVVVKLYNKNSMSQNGRILSEVRVLESIKTPFEISLHNINIHYNFDTLLCCVKVVPYESWKKIQEEKKRVTTTQNVTSCKGPITECKLDDLSSDLRKLLNQGKLSDVILSDGSTDFPAHKLVLSARSSVFSKMFEHPMKENCENRVIISDVPSHILKEFLIFIYTGVVTVKDMKMARDLYVVADKYDVKELRTVCSKHLKEVNLNSVLDTLILANLYEDEVLKQSALEFIARNYSSVKALKNWGIFMKSHQVLAMEVLSFVLDKKT